MGLDNPADLETLETVFAELSSSPFYDGKPKEKALATVAMCRKRGALRGIVGGRRMGDGLYIGTLQRRGALSPHCKRFRLRSGHYGHQVMYVLGSGVYHRARAGDQAEVSSVHGTRATTLIPRSEKN